jgi:hypothetical protein
VGCRRHLAHDHFPGVAAKKIDDVGAVLAEYSRVLGPVDDAEDVIGRLTDWLRCAIRRARIGVAVRVWRRWRGFEARSSDTMVLT